MRIVPLLVGCQDGGRESRDAGLVRQTVPLTTDTGMLRNAFKFYKYDIDMPKHNTLGHLEMSKSCKQASIEIFL